jgi:hypothetical protein
LRRDIVAIRDRTTHPDGRVADRKTAPPADTV